ncbi:unnamed protein product, partial [Citrullus colocynthis]
MVNLMRHPSSRSCHGGSSTGNNRASTRGGGGLLWESVPPMLVTSLRDKSRAFGTTIVRV